MSAAVMSFDKNVAAPVGPFRRLIATAADSLHGLGYWFAAEKDEKDGFPLTAAWEWQRAAECLSWTSTLADRCWRQWERIVHLPRQLSAPIGEPDITPVFVMQRVPADHVEFGQGADALVCAIDSRAA